LLSSEESGNARQQRSPFLAISARIDRARVVIASSRVIERSAGREFPHVFRELVLHRRGGGLLPEEERKFPATEFATRSRDIFTLNWEWAELLAEYRELIGGE